MPARSRSRCSSGAPSTRRSGCASTSTARRARSTSTAIRAASSARGDRATAAKVADGEALLDGARLNWGRHLFLEDKGRIWARFPLRSTLIKPGDDLLEAIGGSLDRLREDGIDVEDGDVLLISEKALAISQGRSYPIDEIPVSRTARVLSRYVSHEPTGVGLAHPTTMQLAIDEAGARRILLAAAAAAATKPLGMRGVFYRVAGHGVNAIDGPSSLNLPPYDKWATKSPVDPSGAALRIAADVRRRTGRRVGGRDHRRQRHGRRGLRVRRGRCRGGSGHDCR